MPTAEELTDAYLVALLAKDTQSKTNKRPRDAPTLNTRFLKSIIRDTTSHNAALLDREKQQQLQHRREDRETARPSKRPRSERPDRWSAVLGVARTSKSERSGEAANHARRGGTERPRQGSERERTNKSQRHLDVKPKHNGERHRLSRSRSPVSSSQPIRRRSRSPRPPRRKAPTAILAHSDDDSDPLESLVGPLPPKQVRGRGRLAGASGIDARFADQAYDPKTDLGSDDEWQDRDWSGAASGLRARFQSKPIDPDRFLAAGFSQEEVKRFQAPAQKSDDIDNVKWQKQGEKREWDRDKVVLDPT